MRKDIITFELSDLRHGWCDILIGINNDEFSDSISYTPNDGLYDFLVSLTKSFVAPKMTRIVCQLSNEPGYFAVSFWNHHPDIRLVIQFVPDYGKSVTDEHKLVFDSTCDLWRFGRKVLQSYQNLLDVYDIEGYQELWGYQFPLREFKDLKSMISKKKLT
jgi:hypothetical protein